MNIPARYFTIMMMEVINVRASSALCALVVVFLLPTHRTSAQSTDTLLAVRLVDRNSGFAVGTSDYVLHTTDGGATWRAQPVSGGTALAAVAAATSNIAFAVGRQGTIVGTTNAGENWRRVAPMTGADLHGVAFVSTRTGWVVGDSATTLSTSNGGFGWSVRKNPLSGTAAAFRAVSFFDGERGCVVGDGGRILLTTDGGNAWSVQSSGTKADLTSVSFADSAKVIAVGLNGTIARTTDLGGNWTLQKSGTTSSLLSITSLYSDTGTAVGEYGTVLRTVDGGSSWFRQAISTGRSLFGVSFSDGRHGAVVGEHSAILTTADGGVTWDHQINPIQEVYRISQGFDLRTWLNSRSMMGTAAWLPSATPPDSFGMEYPRSSGIEHLFGAGMWVGASIDTATSGPPHYIHSVTVGYDDAYAASEILGEMYGNPDGSDSFYVNSVRQLDRPNMRRVDDDHDGRIDEDELDGVDNDGDSKTDEDYGTLSEQDSYVRYSDNYPTPGHIPLNIVVWQRFFSWQENFGRGILPFELIVTNAGARRLDSVYVGMVADCDVGPRSVAGYLTRNYAAYFPDVRTAYMQNPVDAGSTPVGITLVNSSPPVESLAISFQYWSPSGWALNDEERYRRMGAGIEPDQSPSDLADGRFLIGVGPVPAVNPGDTLRITLAFVSGDNLSSGPNNLHDNAAHALSVFNPKWNGSDDSLWTSSRNWAPAGVPTETDTVTILPSPKPPVIFASGEGIKIASLDVADDARLRITDSLRRFSVTSDVTLSGGLAMDSSASTEIVVGGSWRYPRAGPGAFAVARDTFAPGRSTVRFTGRGSFGRNFYDLVFDTSAAMNSMGNVSVVNRCLVEGAVALGRSDTLALLNDSPGALAGTGEIRGGAIRRPVRPASTGIYRFESELTFVSFDTAGLTPAALTMTSYPDSFPPNTDTLRSVRRFYDVAAAGGLGFLARLSLRFDPIEAQGLGASPVWLLRSTDGGSTWDSVGGVYDSLVHTVTVDGISEFSRWKFGSLPRSVGVGENQVLVPRSFELRQSYPNPFNPATTIVYALPVRSRVTLKVYDILGREVETLVDGVEDPGFRKEGFDARFLATGVYFYRLTATGVERPDLNITLIRKMMLVR